MALKKKVAAKRQVWNKGVEVGKRDAFTPAQVKRIRGVLADRGVSGLRDLALFSVAIDTMLQGPELLALTVKRVASKRNDSIGYQGRAHQEKATGPMRLVRENRKITRKMDCRVWHQGHGLCFPGQGRGASASDVGSANAPPAEILAYRGGGRSQ